MESSIQFFVIKVFNTGQEEDVEKYTWDTIPYSLKKFWINYYYKYVLNKKY